MADKEDSLEGWMHVVHAAADLRRQAEHDRRAAAKIFIDNTLASSILPLEKVKMLYLAQQQGILNLDEFMTSLATVLDADTKSDQ